MTRILTRGDTAANWAYENPILMEREMGFETDTLKAKWGDGVSNWDELPYAIEPIPNLALYATLASPTFTGNPKAPTQAVGDNSTNIATTAFVKSQGYATLASPALTGNPTAPTPTASDNDTSIATTAFVKSQGYAPLASPVFTGDARAVTPATADDDTSIATTAFVKAQNYAVFTQGTYQPTVGGVVASAGRFASWSQVGPNVGGIVRVEFMIPVSSMGGGSNLILVSLPAGMTAKMIAGSAASLVGTAVVYDASAGTYSMNVAVGLFDPSNALFYTSAGAPYKNDTPLAFAAGDQIAGSFTFIRAS